MVLIRLLDIIWEMLNWRNIVNFSTRARLMWPITRRFLKQRLLQVLLMSFAVALGFSAYLTFQAIFGSDQNQAGQALAPVDLPSIVIAKMDIPVTPEQMQELDDVAETLVPAWEIQAYIGGQPGRVLAFAPDESFWQEQVSVDAGALELDASQIALPTVWADRLGLSIGDSVNLFHVGNPGPVNQASLMVAAVFSSEKTGMDCPIVLSDSQIMRGYSLDTPNTLYMDFHNSEYKHFQQRLLPRMLRSISSILTPPTDAVIGHPWLRAGEYTDDWVMDARAPLTLLWMGDGQHFAEGMVADIVSNNYSSGKLIVGMVFIFSAICIFNIILISLLTRRRDIGILKTIGYDDLSIFTSFIVEGAVIVGGGIVVGGLFTTGAFWLVGFLTGYTLSTSLAMLLKSGLLSFIIFMSTAAIPADMARYTTVIELLQERALRSSWEEDPLKGVGVSKAPSNEMA